jgi:hypothetical protein
MSKTLKRKLNKNSEDLNFEKVVKKVTDDTKAVKASSISDEEVDTSIKKTNQNVKKELKIISKSLFILENFFINIFKIQIFSCRN